VNIAIFSRKSKVGSPRQYQNQLSDSLMSYQSSKPLTYSQSIIATIPKAKSQSTRSDLSAVKAEITTEPFPRALLFAAAEAIRVTGEPLSVGPRGRWTGAVEAAEAAACGIGDRVDAATLILIHPIGMATIGHGTRKWWRSDAHCARKSLGRSEGKRRATNRRDKASRRKAG
jgi:hypothetical protein